MPSSCIRTGFRDGRRSFESKHLQRQTFKAHTTIIHGAPIGGPLRCPCFKLQDRSLCRGLQPCASKALKFAAALAGPAVRIGVQIEAYALGASACSHVDKARMFGILAFGYVVFRYEVLAWGYQSLNT